jgi:hypothetical protein
MAVIYIIKTKKQEHWFLVTFTVLPVLAFTTIGALRTILPHWPMPGYFSAIPIGALWISSWREEFRYWYSRISLVLTTTLLVLICYHSVHGLFPIDPNTDPTLDGHGWAEVVQYVDTKVSPDYDIDFLFTHKWFLSGELGFAAGPDRIVTLFNRNPQGFGFWTDMNSLLSKNAVFVTNQRFKLNPEVEFKEYFERIEFIAEVPVERGDKPIQTYYVWYCHNLICVYPWNYGMLPDV